MAIFSLVRQEELDVERRQGSFIERQRAFDIGYSQDDVVDHFSFLQIASVSAECLPWTNISSSHAFNEDGSPKFHIGEAITRRSDDNTSSVSWSDRRRISFLTRITRESNCIK